MTTGRTGLVEQASAAVVSYRSGDPGPLDSLVEALTPMLWHQARAQGLSHQEAEDVVQETWFRLVTHLDRINDPGSVLKWLITTTRREAWRVASRSRREAPSDVVVVLPGTNGNVEPNVDDVVIDAVEGDVLWHHVSRLNERCQHLLRVIAFASRPDYASIAEALGMPMGSIGPTRGRCLATLRRSLLADPSFERGGVR